MIQNGDLGTTCRNTLLYIENYICFINICNQGLKVDDDYGQGEQEYEREASDGYAFELHATRT